MAESITRKNIDLDILEYYDGKIKNYIDDKVGTGSLTIDDTLSDTSTNPVQNKVVKQAIDNKADKTVATTSTDGLMSASDKGKLDGVGDTYALKSKYGDTTIDVGRKAGTAGGIRSTAEGYNTTASGDYSHAEGDFTTASGSSSHAEGYRTIASGSYSHAGGCYTKALKSSEFAHGKYNQSNDNTLFSIGDGTADDARHNAFEITTTGGKLHDKDIATTDLIPTELPANGGNADTLGGKSPSDFVEALTIQQTNYTRILIPDNVDARSWLLENAKIGTVYYVMPECQGQINLPPMTAYGWAWFLFDGIRYVAKVMVSAVSAKYYLLDYINVSGDWKEISTTPIKSTTVSGTTNANGNLMLWAASENKIPICAILTGYCSSVFHYALDGNYYLGVSDIATQAYSPNVSVGGTVYYIEQG